VKKAGDRNEALDCLVYGYAAMLLFGRRMNQVTMWEQLADRLEDGKKAPLRSRKKAAPAAPSTFVSNW
jgi:phage terminase large subunit GpA-like protein